MLASLRDAIRCGRRRPRWCRCAQPPANGCDPCRGRRLVDVNLIGVGGDQIQNVVGLHRDVSMMSAERKRRLVRTAKLAVIAVVLLPVEYVGAWLALSRAVNHGVVNTAVGEAVRPVFKPLILYCDLKKPGSDMLYKLWWRVSASSEAGVKRAKQPGWCLSPSLPGPNE